MMPHRATRHLASVTAWLLVAGLGAALLCGQPAPASAQPADAPDAAAAGLRMSLDGGRLSLEADEVPLRRLLAALAERSGFRLELRGELDARVSQSIVDLPLDLAIARILGSEWLSYVLELSAGKLSKLTVIDRRGGADPGARAPAAGATHPDSPEDPSEPQRDENWEAIEVLEQILREEQDPTIREAVVEALQELEAMAQLPR